MEGSTLCTRTLFHDVGGDDTIGGVGLGPRPYRADGGDGGRVRLEGEDDGLILRGRVRVDEVDDSRLAAADEEVRGERRRAR